MGGLFTALFAKLSAIVGWVIDLFKQVFLDVWEMLTDLPLWVMDQVFGLVVSIVGTLDLSALDAYANTWAALPPEIINAAAYLGIVECGAIILAAIGIRLMLQLIPFTRLGS